VATGPRERAAGRPPFFLGNVQHVMLCSLDGSPHFISYSSHDSRLFWSTLRTRLDETKVSKSGFLSFLHGICLGALGGCAAERPFCFLSYSSSSLVESDGMVRSYCGTAVVYCRPWGERSRNEISTTILHDAPLHLRLNNHGL
jgi:hypothetical protein